MGGWVECSNYQSPDRHPPLLQHGKEWSLEDRDHLFSTNKHFIVCLFVLVPEAPASVLGPFTSIFLAVVFVTFKPKDDCRKKSINININLNLGKSSWWSYLQMNVKKCINKCINRQTYIWNIKILHPSLLSLIKLIYIYSETNVGIIFIIIVLFCHIILYPCIAESVMPGSGSVPPGRPCLCSKHCTAEQQ
jgi:hypothetical protein